MLRTVPAVAATLAVVLAVGGCGDALRGDDKVAARNLGKLFAGPNPSKALSTAGDCFGRTVVKDVGITQLKKDKVITADLTAAKMIPKTLSQETAEAVANGVVDCIDFTKLKADFRKESGASAKRVDAYVACLGRIDKDDRRQSLVDQYTEAKPTGVRKKVEAATKTCEKNLGA